MLQMKYESLLTLVSDGVKFEVGVLDTLKTNIWSDSWSGLWPSNSNVQRLLMLFVEKFKRQILIVSIHKLFL